MTAQSRPIIFSESPYAAVVSSSHLQRQNICFSCFKVAPRPLRCSKCHLASYCGEECQKEDWKSGQHRRECKVFAATPERHQAALRELQVLRLVARVLARKETDHGITDGSELLTDQEMKQRKMSDLRSNVSEPVFRRNWTLFNFLYRARSKFFTGIDEDAFRHVLGLVQSNAFGIYDNDIYLGSVNRGMGLYLQSARFSHSCDPDLFHFFEGAAIRVGLHKPIDLTQTDLDSLTIRYRHPNGGGVTLTSDRRDHLARLFSFKCKCSLCQNEELDIIKHCSVVAQCPQCKQGLVVTMEPEKAQFKCLHCGNKMGKKEDALATRYMILLLHDAFYGGPERKPVRADLFHFIEKAAKWLDSFRNIWLLRLREAALFKEWKAFRKDNLHQRRTFLRSPKGLAWYEQLSRLFSVVAATYRLNGVDGPFFPAVCANVAQVHLEAGEKLLAKKTLEEARVLWADVVYCPGHPCVAQAQAKIDRLA